MIAQDRELMRQLIELLKKNIAQQHETSVRISSLTSSFERTLRKILQEWEESK